MTSVPIFREDKPVIPRRGVHLDLKGLPPTPSRMIQLLKLFAATRYNVVLVEWEDSFPWTVDERFRSPTAYSPADIKRFTDTAVELDLEFIPLVQCMGHMETPLSVPGYERLREVPDNSSCLNPLADGARELIQGMVDDVLTLMPDTKHFHLGGDEAWLFGTHPDTKAYVEKHGKGELYMHHVGPILDSLNERGVRPILWHDMMNEWDTPALEALAQKADLMPWGYRGHPDTNEGHCSTKHIQRFHDHGISMWGGTAYKGAEGYDVDLPVIELHTENAQGWVEIAQRFNFKGVVATAWSRYSSDTIQCNPIDSSLDSLANVAIILHDGKPPANGTETCIALLEDAGEKERFKSCRDAMAKVADVRRAGWEHVKQARQQIALAELQPNRTSALNRSQGMKKLNHLQNVVNRSEKVTEEVRQSFAGLLDPVWIEEYLTTRFKPLRDELKELDALVD